MEEINEEAEGIASPVGSMLVTSPGGDSQEEDGGKKRGVAVYGLDIDVLSPNHANAVAADDGQPLMISIGSPIEHVAESEYLDGGGSHSLSPPREVESPKERSVESPTDRGVEEQEGERSEEEPYIYKGAKDADGLPHGWGVCIYRGGQARYEGEWRHGLAYGEGKFYFPNGRRFEGHVKHGRPHNGKVHNRAGKVVKSYREGELFEESDDEEDVGEGLSEEQIAAKAMEARARVQEARRGAALANAHVEILEAEKEMREAALEIEEAHKTLQDTRMRSEKERAERVYLAAMETLEAAVPSVAAAKGPNSADLFTLQVAVSGYGAKWSFERDYGWFKDLEDQLQAGYKTLKPEEGGAGAVGKTLWNMTSEGVKLPKLPRQLSFTDPERMRVAFDAFVRVNCVEVCKAPILYRTYYQALDVIAHVPDPAVVFHMQSKTAEEKDKSAREEAEMLLAGLKEMEGDERAAASRAARRMYGWISVGGATSQLAKERQKGLGAQPRLMHAVACVLVAGPCEARFNACRMLGRVVQHSADARRRALREKGVLEALIFCAQHTPAQRNKSARSGSLGNKVQYDLSFFSDGSLLNERSRDNTHDDAPVQLDGDGFVRTMSREQLIEEAMSENSWGSLMSSGCDEGTSTGEMPRIAEVDAAAELFDSVRLNSNQFDSVQRLSSNQLVRKSSSKISVFQPLASGKRHNHHDEASFTSFDDDDAERAAASPHSDRYGSLFDDSLRPLKSINGKESQVLFDDDQFDDQFDRQLGGSIEESVEDEDDDTEWDDGWGDSARSEALGLLAKIVSPAYLAGGFLLDANKIRSFHRVA